MGTDKIKAEFADMILCDADIGTYMDQEDKRQQEFRDYTGALSENNSIVSSAGFDIGYIF